MHSNKAAEWRLAQLGASLLIIGVMTPFLARASIYEYASGDHEILLGGRIRQDTVWSLQRRDGGKVQNVADEYLVEPILNYDYKQWLRFKLDLTLQGDPVFRLRSTADKFGFRFPGNPNQRFQRYFPRSAELLTRFEKNLNSGSFNWVRDNLIRELSLTATDREAGYTITVGKFQRGWGQADGLRAMDVLNPLDYRKRFLFRDSDELRINQWMVDALFFIDRYLPVDMLGVRGMDVEFLYIPNIRNAEFLVNNPFDNESGGIWGFPLPTRGEPRGVLPDRVYVHLIRKPAIPGWMEFSDPALAARLAFDIFETHFTISGYYGREELPVTRLLNGELHAGPDGRGPLIATFDPALSAVAYDLLQQGSTVLQDTNTSVVGNVLLDWTSRRKLMGFTASRDLTFIRLPPKGVSPVLRMEASYQFDRIFNTVEIVNTDQNALRQKDFVTLLLGFDYFLWLPDDWYGNWFFTQRRAIFTSFQVFDFHVMGGTGAGRTRLLWVSPYIDWKRPANELWYTFLWSTDVYSDLIHLEGLNVWEQQNSGFAVRQRIDLNFFGDHWRPRIELLWLEGKGDQSTGVFDENDGVDFQLTYQW